jgi:hypothetical protein
VPGGHEAHVRRTARTVQRPARERPGHLLHVALGVARVDAERVELEQLARVVLVRRASVSATDRQLSR